MSDSRSIDQYLVELASASPTPGGGSVAGIIAALAAGLGSMVCSLTREPANIEDREALTTAATNLRAARVSALAFSERDEAAYAAYITATRLPKVTSEDKTVRRDAIQAALRTAAEVPLALAEHCIDLLQTLCPVISYGNPHLQSDARIAVMLADTAHRAALVNVRVNLALLKDRDLADHMEVRAQASEQLRGSAVLELERTLESRAGR